jgi:hypothetical protein
MISRRCLLVTPHSLDERNIRVYSRQVDSSKDDDDDDDDDDDLLRVWKSTIAVAATELGNWSTSQE